MVNYKTRIFFEKDTNSLGADVFIYSDEGDLIDTILITTESKYNELAEQIQNIDATYIDMAELTEVLKNTQNELVINATTFGGLTVNDFSQTGHTHSGYAVTNHASTRNDFGLGTGSQYGHNKIIDNLTKNEFVNGEALAAHQGKVLMDAINTVNNKLVGEYVASFNNPANKATVCRITLKKIGNIVFCVYHVNYKSYTSHIGEDVKVSNTNIPVGFRPGYPAYFSVSEYNSNDNMLLFFDTDGKIYCRGHKKAKINVYGSCFWFIDEIPADSDNSGDDNEV
jgi:hypothetical protein